MSVAKALQSVFRTFGFSITRLPANRFDVMGDVLDRLKREGVAPDVVIDVGANCGQFASVLTAVFPETPVHLVEPQPSCQADLQAFAVRRGHATVHPVLLTAPGIGRTRLVGEGTTGAHVVEDPSRTDGRVLEATTLDAEIGPALRRDDRVMLKLDVEGHELQVLAGGPGVLAHVDVILTEVTFFDVNRAGLVTFLPFANALASQGFTLYDFAALGSRARDGRLRTGDAVFVRRGAALLSDDRWA